MYISHVKLSAHTLYVCTYFFEVYVSLVLSLNLAQIPAHVFVAQEPQRAHSPPPRESNHRFLSSCASFARQTLMLLVVIP